MKKIFCFLVIFFAFLSLISGQERKGANKAAPAVEIAITSMNLKNNTRVIFSEEQTRQIISVAAENGINVFELIDCLFRVLNTRNIRIILDGNALRKVQDEFKLGDERVLALLPIQKLIKLEIGAAFLSNEKSFDVYLDSKHETFIEIGTALYSERFGFASLSPLLFEKPYGIMVKKFFFTAPLVKLELYAPGKGAIYANGLPIPKKWNLELIHRK